MRGLALLSVLVGVIALAIWAYQQNYRTQRVIAETVDLQRDIGEARSRLSVLRAEWAYLNRPDRLRDLADINFDRLGLLPLRPDQFGHADQVALPPDPIIEFENAVDVSSLGDAQPGEVVQ